MTTVSLNTKVRISADLCDEKATIVIPNNFFSQSFKHSLFEKVELNDHIKS